MTRTLLLTALLTAELALLLAPTLSQAADENTATAAKTCQANAGTLLVGKLSGAPRFKHGKFRKGVELSHTHLTVIDEQGRRYDVAIDNVFAAGYQKNMKSVPAPLNTLQDGDRIQACGAPFKGGIHWVHTNCGSTPRPGAPNGWLKKVHPDGSVSENYEGGEGFCNLWPKKY